MDLVEELQARYVLIVCNKQLISYGELDLVLALSFSHLCWVKFTEEVSR